MSINKYTTAEGLVTLANGSRMWVGTKAAYEAAKQAGTMPNDVLVAITDDSQDNHYSTEEVLTGKFWIDGKPIYRKVVPFGNKTVTTSANILITSDLNSTNISDLIHSDLIWSTGSVSYANSTYCILYIESSGISVGTFGSSFTTGPNACYIFEYTKTTD